MSSDAGAGRGRGAADITIILRSLRFSHGAVTVPTDSLRVKASIYEKFVI